MKQPGFTTSLFDCDDSSASYLEADLPGSCRMSVRSPIPSADRPPSPDRCEGAPSQYSPPMQRFARGLVVLGLALVAAGCHGAEIGADRPAPTTLAACRDAGGMIRRVGMAQVNACVRLYSDRGRECSSHSEGECRFEDDLRGPPPESPGSEPAWMHPVTIPPVGSQVVGHCQWSSDQFGCRSLVEGGLLGAVECVD